MNKKGYKNYCNYGKVDKSINNIVTTKIITIYNLQIIAIYFAYRFFYFFPHICTM